MAGLALQGQLLLCQVALNMELGDSSSYRCKGGDTGTNCRFF
jgi:hypothetical protein